MKKTKLLSLQCTSESFEKSIALIYYSFKDNYNFYKDYDTYVFFGHNLPKKEKNIHAQGTIGFYDQYYSNSNIFKNLSKDSLLKYKNNILLFLINRGIINHRVLKKFINDDNMYWNFIKNLPFEFLYPNHFKRILNFINEEYKIKIKPLFLENNLLEIVLGIKNNTEKYSIYALNYNGTIARYYLNYKDDLSFSHFCKMLYRQPVLSGNSALLLENVSKRIGKNYIIGYRPHSGNKRPNRDYALSKLLDKHSSMLEPKITRINELFGKINNDYSIERKANEVYAYVYLDFLNNYSDKLSFKNISEEWWNENS